MLFLAFNRDIREEVQALVTKHCLGHVDVENYDSLLVNFYDPRAASQDFQMSMRKVLGSDAPPYRPVRWDAVFIDEAQDMDDVFLSFVEKVLRDNAVPRASVQIVSVGDPKQSIFKYRGADARFFMEEGRLHGEVETLRLAATFRFSREVCAFVDDVCGPLFPVDYFGPSSRGQPPPLGGACLEHWILPAARERAATALVQRLKDLRALQEDAERPQDRLLAFLTGSKKESNDALWGFVEDLGAATSRGQAPALVTEDPTESPEDGPAIAFVRNVHETKGQTFATAVLFVTTRRSWIGEDNAVERETLYVALTRARRLLIVEAEDSLIFQEVLQQIDPAKGPGGLPRPKCAATGEFLQLPIQKQSRLEPVSFAKLTLREQAGKLSVETKQELLKLVEAPEMCEWEDTEGEARDTAPSPRDALVVAAAWIRTQHLQGEERSRFNDFFQALARDDSALEKAYAKLWRSRRRRPLLPHLRARLEGLARLVRSGAALPVSAYLAAARLHHDFQYGHLALPKATAEEERACLALSQALRSETERSGATHALYELLFYRENRRGDRAPRRPTIEWGLFLGGGDGNSSVALLRAENVRAEALNDRLLAAYACAKMGVADYEIVYVPVGGNGPVRRAQGKLPCGPKGAQYARAFERAVEAL